METQIIKKGKAIDHLVSGYSPGKIEEERSMVAEGGKFYELAQKYVQYVEVFNQGREVDDILIPAEIDSFLRGTEFIEVKRKQFFAHPTFISKLIQNSYNAGYNDFHFSTTRSPIYSHLATGVVAKPENPCNITIEGHARSASCRSVRHVNLTVYGDAGTDLAQGAKDSNITVHGNCKSSCGTQTRASSFIINGNVERSCGSYSRGSTFLIGGRIFKEFTEHMAWDEIPGMKARGSTFKTPHLKELMTLSLAPAGNRIIYIHPDGREEVARDFGDRGIPK